MITAFGDISTAIEAMKRGANDYINKPFDLDELRLLIDKVIENASVYVEAKSLRNQQLRQYSFSSIVGKNKSILEVVEFAKKLVNSSASPIFNLWGEWHR